MKTMTKSNLVADFVWACVNHVATFCSLMTDNCLLKGEGGKMKATAMINFVAGLAWAFVDRFADVGRYATSRFPLLTENCLPKAEERGVT